VLADSRSHSIDSLWKLHHKATAIDNYYDARIEPDTSRAAWNEVRDNVERGTPTQPTARFEAHICSRNSSSAGIPEHADDRYHKPSYCTKGKRCTSRWIGYSGLLPIQKETQDRTRKRIKEDLKDSASDHADYAENTLPKLKRAYIKKCQDFEVTIIPPYFLCCITTLMRYWCLGLPTGLSLGSCPSPERGPNVRCSCS